MVKFAVGIEYSGTAYCGWQRQQNSGSIQARVEDALSFVADHAIKLVCAGRTDAGVHAVEQVAHFETDVHRDLKSWLRGANSELPKDIRLKWVVSIDKEFHARFTATARQYRYIILNSSVPSALFHDKASWEFQPLDQEKMHEAAQDLLGEHDFSAFRAVGCQAESAIRCIDYISLTRNKDLIYLDIRANAFLYHMVRNIVGSLVVVGKGDQPRAWLGELLEARDRNRAAATAPACGLYLLRAFYPERFKLPIESKKPVLF